MSLSSSQPAVSVIIPTYNQADLLEEALRSVRDQSFTNWEAIVINNFSPDHTERVVQSAGDRFRLVNFHNHGVIGAARNLGGRHSTGDFIAFLDSDDTWHPEKLQRVMRVFEDNPAVDLVCNDEYLLSEDGQRRVLTYGPHMQYADLLFRGNCLSTSAIVVRREYFNKVGGFSENPAFAGAEDYELWLRLAREGCRFFYLHEVLGTFRVHGGAYTKNIERHCQNILNALDAHFAGWPRPSPYFHFLMRRQKSATIRSAAHTLIKEGERKKAGELIARSLRQNPLSWKAWLLGIMNVAKNRI